jgi:acetoin utilization deacetylase AcuC-like enzyme
VVKEVNNYFQPDAIVCQCGVDGLAGDPMNSFNLTQYGLAACVHYISSLEKPLLLLGGGKDIRVPFLSFNLCSQESFFLQPCFAVW